MRQLTTYASFILLITALFSALGIVGCGDTDILDNERVMYAVDLTTMNGEVETNDVDVVMSVCESGEDEQIGKFGAKVTIVANSDVPDLRVLGYTFRIYPIGDGKYLDSDDAFPESTIGWANVDPPALPSALTPRTISYTSPRVMSEGSLTFEIDLWTQFDKLYYTYTVLEVDNFYDDHYYGEYEDSNGTIWVGWDYGIEAEWTQFEYNYVVTFHCKDTEGNEFDLEGSPNSWAIFANYDNCD